MDFAKLAERWNYLHDLTWEKRCPHDDVSDFLVARLDATFHEMGAGR